MTESEAIKVLKMVETHGALTTNAKELAIKALEKQIPKKPIRNYPLKNEAWSESAMLCPTCNKYVSVYSDKYCCCCGQKLDWELGEWKWKD